MQPSIHGAPAEEEKNRHTGVVNEAMHIDSHNSEENITKRDIYDTSLHGQGKETDLPSGSGVNRDKCYYHPSVYYYKKYDKYYDYYKGRGSNWKKYYDYYKRDDKSSDTKTGTTTKTKTGTRTGTTTGTRTRTRTGTATGTRTGTATGTRTGTATGTRTGTATGTRTGTKTGTKTGTRTGTKTRTKTGTRTPGTRSTWYNAVAGSNSK